MRGPAVPPPGRAHRTSRPAPMTFRASPSKRTAAARESRHRRNLYFNLGFGAVVVVAIILLVGAGLSLVQRPPRGGGGRERRDHHEGRARATASPRRRGVSIRRVTDPREGHRRQDADLQGQPPLSERQPQETGRDPRLRARDRHHPPPASWRPTGGHGHRGRHRRPLTEEATTPETPPRLGHRRSRRRRRGATEPTTAQIAAARPKATRRLGDLRAASRGRSRDHRLDAPADRSPGRRSRLGPTDSTSSRTRRFVQALFGQRRRAEHTDRSSRARTGSSGSVA